MPVLYMSLDYEQYKGLEAQLRRWEEVETTHESTGGYYHKSLRLKVGDTVLEFHGPIVKAREPSP